LLIYFKENDSNSFGVFVSEIENNKDITSLLLETSEAVRELNLVNYDFLRIIKDDFSNLSREDSEILHASINTAEMLLANEKLSSAGGKKYSGDEEELKKLLGELRYYLTVMKMKRTLYELKLNASPVDPNAETYEEQQKRTEAKRKKLRETRKKKKKK